MQYKKISKSANKQKLILSAKFGIYPSNLTVRGNWVNTITINLE